MNIEFIEPTTSVGNFDFLIYLSIFNFNQQHDYSKLIHLAKPGFNILDLLPAFGYSFQEHRNRFFKSSLPNPPDLLKKIINTQQCAWPVLLIIHKPHFILYKQNVLNPIQNVATFEHSKHAFVNLIKQIQFFLNDSKRTVELTKNAETLLTALQPQEYLFYGLHGSLADPFSFYVVHTLKTICMNNIPKLTVSFVTTLNLEQLSLVAKHFYTPIANILSDYNFSDYFWPFKKSTASLGNSVIVARTNTQSLVKRIIGGQLAQDFLSQSLTTSKPTWGFRFNERLFALRYFPKIELYELTHYTPPVIITVATRPEICLCESRMDTISNQLGSIISLPNSFLNSYMYLQHKSTNMTLYKKQIKIDFANLKFVHGHVTTDRTLEITEVLLYVRPIMHDIIADVDLFCAYFLNILTPPMYKEYTRNEFLKIFLSSIGKTRPAVDVIDPGNTLNNHLWRYRTRLTFNRVSNSLSDWIYAFPQDLTLLTGQQTVVVNREELTVASEWRIDPTIHILEPFNELRIELDWDILKYQEDILLLIFRTINLSIQDYKNKQTEFELLPSRVQNIVQIYKKRDLKIFFIMNPLDEVILEFYSTKLSINTIFIRN